MNIIIKLNQINDLYTFVQEIHDMPCDVDAFKNHYVIDAKSILGLMSLSLSEPITVRVNTDDEEIIKQFEKICLKYKA